MKKKKEKTDVTPYHKELKALTDAYTRFFKAVSKYASGPFELEDIVLSCHAELGRMSIGVIDKFCDDHKDDESWGDHENPFAVSEAQELRCNVSLGAMIADNHNIMRKCDGCIRALKEKYVGAAEKK